MVVKFYEEDHRYESDPPIDWTSVTRVVEKFCPEFDEVAMSESCSKKEGRVWYGLDPTHIRELWEQENKRSTDCGHWFHGMMEERALKAGQKIHRGQNLAIYGPIIKDGIKYAPDQILAPGIYPEHFMYSEKHAICGQSDLVYVSEDGYVDVDDFKTNKKIEMRGFGWDRGRPKMMLKEMSHLEDCNLIHYQLQLSIYMKLILMKNPGLKPGRMRIYHVTFEIEGKDKFGFPILKRISDGGYVVTGGSWYNMEYMQKEVDELFK